MYSPTEENYLKALLNLADEKGEVSVNDLSKRLSISMPTVNSMVKKLAEKDLLHYESYKPLRLTEKGEKSAALIIRKHRLTEMYLVEKMGFGWEQVHHIAEQVEHVQSEEFFEKIDELLGYPTVDPHGSPIPDKNGVVEWLEYIKMSECKVGQQVELAAVTNSSKEFLNFLNGRSMQLGTKIKILSIEKFDGSFQVSYAGHKAEMLSKMVVDNLLVKN